MQRVLHGAKSKFMVEVPSSTWMTSVHLNRGHLDMNVKHSVLPIFSSLNIVRRSFHGISENNLYAKHKDNDGTKKTTPPVSTTLDESNATTNENQNPGVPVSLNSSSISHKWNVVEFDDQGNVRMSQIKRSELYTKYGLQGRDIRILGMFNKELD